jgi:hypothetical protein
MGDKDNDDRCVDISIAIVRFEREDEPGSELSAERLLDELSDARKRQREAERERDYRNRN